MIWTVSFTDSSDVVLPCNVLTRYQCWCTVNGEWLRILFPHHLDWHELQPPV